jgi:predicted YcjX-like family ATPase
MIGDFLRNGLRDLSTHSVSIGVTGFSRAGKTVFITALAQALLTAEAWSGKRGQGPLAQFGPFERGHFRSARIRDDMHGDKPQFPFRKVRDALVGRNAAWPAPTEGLSRLVIDLEGVPQSSVRNWLSEKGGLHELGLGRVQVELVDYPGEWLVDLSMLQMDFNTWSNDMLSRAVRGPRHKLSADFFRELDGLPKTSAFDDEWAGRLSEAWAGYLWQAVGLGLVLNQPGRLLRPDKLAHSPVLRLSPLPKSHKDSDFYRGMAERFELYKKSVIRPFYQDHFARIDRQVVLVDVLRALQHGEAAFEEMTEALAETLHSFDYSRGGWLARLMGARTSHVLFAATKADHVTRGDRANLEGLLRQMLSRVDGDNRLRADALKHAVMALASIRATEDRMTNDAPRREILFGRRAEDDTPDQWDPGGLPLDCPPDWSKLHFEFLDFAPTPMTNALQQGFPTIQLGKALNFLLGEDFR